MPRRKKDPSVRSRRNTAATRATLKRVADESSLRGELEVLTVALLREAVDLANASRPADAQLPRTGRKAELVDRLVAAQRAVPDMPPHPPRYAEDGYSVPADWHEQTVAWWDDVWTSPMAAEWDVSDVHNVAVVALLYDDIWTATTARERKDALSEYRLQRADLGLSPYSRRRLEWTIEAAGEAKDRGKERRSRQTGAGAPGAGSARTATADDPRRLLHSVS